MKIQIYNDINDKKLINSWKTIVERNNYLPQSTYEWCSTWWKYFSDSKKDLHIITVFDKNDIVGIAPMFIEKKIFNKQMKFIGVGLTDFHELLIEKSKYEMVFRLLKDYFQSFKRWDIVLLDQINDELSDYKYYIKNSVNYKFRVECPIVDFNNLDWEPYLQNLKGSDRRNFIKKKRKIDRELAIKFEEISHNNFNSEIFEEVAQLHISRWDNKKGDSKFINNSIKNFISEVLESLLINRYAKIFILKEDNQLLAYQIGFINKNIFYGWNISFNRKYYKYSPGLIITGLITKNLIENHISNYNHMRGGGEDHSYKMRWMMKGHEHISRNYLFILSKPNIKGKILEKYYLVWRDQIKDKFNNILQNRYFRRLMGLK